MVSPIKLLVVLERQALAGLPPNAAIGSHADVHGLLDGRPLAVTAKVAVQGETALTYRYGGARMQRISLLRLICTERACTEAELAKDRWNEFAARRGDPSP